MAVDPISLPVRAPHLTFEQLLPYLPDAQISSRDPQQAYATCPACGHGRALSIRLGGEKYAYPMRCHGRDGSRPCTWEAVMAAAHLRWEDVAYADEVVSLPAATALDDWRERAPDVTAPAEVPSVWERLSADGHYVRREGREQRVAFSLPESDTRH